MMAVRSARPVKDIMPSKGVCRKLFGDPDHDETRRLLAREMTRLDQQTKQRWSFDFAVEEPLTGGRYEWEKIEAEEQVPEAYAMPQLDIDMKRVLARLHGAEDDGLTVPSRCVRSPRPRATSPDSTAVATSPARATMCVSAATQTTPTTTTSSSSTSCLSVDTDTDSQLSADVSQQSPRPQVRSLKRKQRHITEYFSQTKRARHNSINKH